MPTGRRALWDSVHDAIAQSKTLTLRTTTYLPHERVHIDRILGAFLDASGMISIKDKLGYCVHELAGNAKKANTKRLYFLENKLDIADAADYGQGMKGFKRETTEHIGQYLEKLKEAGLCVKFQFRKLRNGVRISVHNNVTLTAAEEARITEKIAIARQYTCFAEAFTSIEDGTEGAGLGLVMMMFMLKSLGFGQDAFTMRIANGETVATLKLEAPDAAAEPGAAGSASA